MMDVLAAVDAAIVALLPVFHRLRRDRAARHHRPPAGRPRVTIHNSDRLTPLRRRAQAHMQYLRLFAAAVRGDRVLEHPLTGERMPIHRHRPELRGDLRWRPRWLDRAAGSGR